MLICALDTFNELKNKKQSAGNFILDEPFINSSPLSINKIKLYFFVIKLIHQYYIRIIGHSS